MVEFHYTIHQRETLFQGYFRVTRLHLSHTKFNGGTLGPFTREVLERGQAVAVLPYDPLTDHVLLIEQFRPGPVLAGDSNPWVLEIIAGIIESGENPEQVARREAREEAGCVLTDCALIHQCYISPGCTSETCGIFIGRANLDRADGVFGIAAEHEDIRSHILPLDEALEWLAHGKICTVPAIIALQWLALHRDELREAWQGF